MKRTKKCSLLTATGAVAGIAMGATIALAAHPPVPLYTYEEVAAQYGMPKMPVMVDAKHQGFPYSPKQTCFGAVGCHGDSASTNPKLTKNYDDLSKHAFHSSLGFNEWMDNDYNGDGLFMKNGIQTGLNPQKPWLQSHGHNGKW